MEPTCNVSSPVDAPARLSYAQKRDLLGQAVAAVITTALIAAPLLTPTPDGSATAPLAALPAASFAAPVAAIAVVDVTTPALLRESARRAESRRIVRGSPAESTAVMPIAGNSRVLETPVGTSGREPGRKPLSRRLTGWLTGNGTHAVRPFPTISPGRP